jgi:hypothetical protein
MSSIATLQPNETQLGKYTPPAASGLANVNIDALFQLALDKQVGVDTMERMMAMRRELMAEQAKREFNDAMAHFQSVCPIIPKTKSVSNSENKGGGHRYNFAPLDYIVAKVRDLLVEHGFSYTFDSETADNKVKAICIISHNGGHTEQRTFELVIEKGPGMNMAQGTASTLSYAKRYAFLGAFGIQTGEDDDALSALPTESARRRLELLQAMREQQPSDDDNFTHEDPDAPVSKPVTHVPETVSDTLRDFLTSVADSTTAEDLTPKVKEVENFTGPEMLTARRAVHNRSLKLKLRWSGTEFTKSQQS